MSADFGVRWILKESPNRQFSNKINKESSKRVSRKVSWKNMILGWVFDTKMGGLEELKQAFRIRIVATHEFGGVMKHKEF